MGTTSIAEVKQQEKELPKMYNVIKMWATIKMWANLWEQPIELYPVFREVSTISGEVLCRYIG